MKSEFADLVSALAVCSSAAHLPVPADLPEDRDAAALEAQSARLAPTDLTADLTALPPREREALVYLIHAAHVMDAVYLRQVWAGNEATFRRLQADSSRLGRARLHAFLINKGPWSRLDRNEAFVPGVPDKPRAATFYPPDATKADIDRWLASLAPSDRAVATGFFTTIRRGPGGGLVAVPYGTEYQEELALAARHLHAAARATEQPTLRAFLEARAAAFVSNDYFESDVRWMELDATIEPTIGPYEVYEDEWFNYKAAFEAFITVKDEDASDRLQSFASSLQEIEDNLPVDPKYRNPRLGTLAPIAVVNTVFSAGEGNRGVQAAAFNLPNDERVIREKGSKRVMLKNTQQAKFDRVLVPIATIALSADDQRHVSFDAFFIHILMHELMHGLGPHDMTVAGRTTTVRQELQDTYSTIEEAKADISALFALQLLIDRGRLAPSLERAIYTTFLASSFRTLRFGVNEAHGQGQAIQLNYLLDHGGFRVNSDGTFGLDIARIRTGVTALTRRLLTLEARGDHGEARQLVGELGVIRPAAQAILARLAHVPVDIEPRFPAAIALA